MEPWSCAKIRSRWIRNAVARPAGRRYERGRPLTMRKERRRDCLLLVGAVALSRALFQSHYPYDLDSVNFVLALKTFDPEVHQPHPPGYFLYVWAGRVANSVFSDANAALVFLSILASCGAAVLIYTLAHEWFGRRAAIFASVAFLVSPLCWFYGTVALTYIPETFFSALVGWLCWKTYTGRPGYLLPSALALAAAAGFRQSSILFLGPLWLWSLRGCRPRQAIVGFLALGLGMLAWFLPMLRESGGAEKYWAALADLWNRVAGAQAVLSVSPVEAAKLLIERLYTLFRAYALCFLAAAPLPLLRPFPSMDRAQKQFLLAWVAPGIAFCLLVFMPFVNSGYALVLTPPIFALLGAYGAAWQSSLQGSRHVKTAFQAALGLASVAVFLFAPLYCSYSRVRFLGSELAATRESLRELFDPSDTLLVGGDFHMQGFRHAGYALPEFLTVQFPEKPSERGLRVFVMRQRETAALSEIPAGPYQRFVLFPVADIGGLQDRMRAVQAHFADGALQTMRSGDREFVVGSTADLHFLFPSTARRTPHEGRAGWRRNAPSPGTPPVSVCDGSSQAVDSSGANGSSVQAPHPATEQPGS